MPLNILKLFFALSLFLAAASVSAESNPRVEIDTNYGNIVVELYLDKAPVTVVNFLNYVDSGFYTDTIFHRVIKDFMVQGGGFNDNYEQKPTQDGIKNEANNGLSNQRGTLAMARTSIPDSATAQFFINTVDNSRLDFRHASRNGWGYCVFGKVIEGMSVIDEIEATPTGPAGPFDRDAPQVLVVIEKISRVNEDTEPTKEKIQ